MSGLIDDGDPQLLYPLSLFCDINSNETLSIRGIADSALAEPYRSLLAHDSDMTTKLENYYHGSIELLVLKCRTEDNSHRREVVLRMKENKQPIEYGAIDINLAAFKDPVREQILEGHRPLGGILLEHKIQYKSQPKLFIELTSNKVINNALGLARASVLYGRSNVLIGASEVTLAHIVEILPPSS